MIETLGSEGFWIGILGCDDFLNNTLRNLGNLSIGKCLRVARLGVEKIVVRVGELLDCASLFRSAIAGLEG